jgi:serine/threonine protein kinase
MVRKRGLFGRRNYSKAVLFERVFLCARRDHFLVFLQFEQLFCNFRWVGIDYVQSKPNASATGDPEEIYQKQERIGKGSFGEVYKGYVRLSFYFHRTQMNVSF